MDIVYIAGRFSHCDRNDLRYSLRSLEKFGTGIDKVYVVGDAVPWLSDSVVNVKYEQPYQMAHSFREKHTNLQETLRFIAKNLPIDSEFVYSSDDHYLTKTVNFNNYQYYMKLTRNGCELPTIPGSDYEKALVSTRKFLEEKGLPTKYMTVHRDMRLRVDAIKECEVFFDEILDKKLSVEPFVLLGNYMVKKYNIDVFPVRDYKIKSGSEWWKSNPSVTDMYSISELRYNWLDDLLLGEYPKKSNYEK